MIAIIFIILAVYLLRTDRRNATKASSQKTIEIPVRITVSFSSDDSINHKS